MYQVRRWEAWLSADVFVIVQYESDLGYLHCGLSCHFKQDDFRHDIYTYRKGRVIVVFVARSCETMLAGLGAPLWGLERTKYFSLSFALGYYTRTSRARHIWFSRLVVRRRNLVICRLSSGWIVPFVDLFERIGRLSSVPALPMRCRRCWKNFPLNCGPLSTKIRTIVSYSMTHKSKTISVKRAAVVFLFGITLINLERRSAITNTNLLLVFVLVSGPDMSLPINSNEPLTVNSFIRRWCDGCCQCLLKSRHFLT